MASSYNVPVPVVCSGIIRMYIEEDDLYEVKIEDTPLDGFMDVQSCKLIYSPGSLYNYKVGTRVKVLVTFTYNTYHEKYEGVDKKPEVYIIGLYNENSITKKRVRSPITETEENVSWVNPRTGAGISTNKQGSLILGTSGAIKSTLNPFGHGMDEHSHKTEAMNHHRIISHNPDFYSCREHFGFYTGKNDDEKSSNTSAKDKKMIYRRFVTQTADITKWVSTCEGTWDPWVGPNNECTEVIGNSGILFSKVIHSGESRLSIEAGEEGDGFFSMYVDQVLYNEKYSPSKDRSTQGVVGNKFKFQVSEKGDLLIRAGGKGVPGKKNLNTFMLKASADGELIITASKKIVLTHGDKDQSINSIVLDPAAGVDITAMNGFRVNGKPLAAEAIVDLLIRHQLDLCFTTGLGAPAQINPIVVKELEALAKTPIAAGGLKSIQTGPMATGVTIDEKAHHKTVPS